MARARLRDRHQNNLMKKLLLLKNQQGVKEEQGDDPRPGPSGVKDEPIQINEDSRNTKGTSEDESDDEAEK